VIEDQKAVALARAQHARLAGAALCATIRAAGHGDGPLLAARAVQAGEHSVRFLSLLRAVPGIGETHARRMLRNAEINPVERIDSKFATDRRRQLLIAELVAWAERYDEQTGRRRRR
jgi:hypothetical protein